MSSPPTATTAQSTRLDQRIKQHKAEVALLREQIGDPEEALSRLIVSLFEIQALLPDDQTPENWRGRTWDEDDDLSAW